MALPSRRSEIPPASFTLRLAFHGSCCGLENGGEAREAERPWLLANKQPLGFSQNLYLLAAKIEKKKREREGIKPTGGKACRGVELLQW